jgi:hypothetical protein
MTPAERRKPAADTRIVGPLLTAGLRPDALNPPKLTGIARLLTPHRAQLEHPEFASVKSHATVRDQRRPARLYGNRCTRGHDHRTREQQCTRCENAVGELQHTIAGTRFHSRCIKTHQSGSRAHVTSMPAVDTPEHRDLVNFL